MRPVTLIADDIQKVANWPLVVEALRTGHELPKADIGDTFVHADYKTMLVRSAFINGLAAGVKAATVVPDNPQKQPPLPSIHAQIMLFDPNTGELTALVDGTEVTAWKTAGDSALGSALLSRPESKTLLMVGAGAMAIPLIEAHLSVRRDLDTVMVWNRTSAKAQAICEKLQGKVPTIETAADLDAAIPQADIICCATMTNEPVLKGALVQAGTHVDLVGAYKADMREADDDLHHKARWFVDSFDTTLDHIGELKIPLDQGVIDRNSVKGDLHQLVAGSVGRKDDQDITVFKNGGGAHLDIMVSSALVKAFEMNG